MKQIFTARHGDYDIDGRLTPNGCHQIELLSNAIKEILNDNTVYLISSTAPRALDSARILIAQLGLPKEFEQIPYLWSGRSAPKDEGYNFRVDLLENLIIEKEKKADALILVTHEEIIEDLQCYSDKFGRYPDIKIPSKGEAGYFDLESKTYKIIPE